MPSVNFPGNWGAFGGASPTILTDCSGKTFIGIVGGYNAGETDFGWYVFEYPTGIGGPVNEVNYGTRLPARGILSVKPGFGLFTYAFTSSSNLMYFPIPGFTECGSTAGPPGPSGPNGTNGSNGIPGSPGAAGATGGPGVTGSSGGMGPAGPLGPTGPRGTTGYMGPQGPAGADCHPCPCDCPSN